MLIGVPKEIKTNENRIALVPAGAEALISAGHQVFIEKGAGLGSGFPDALYKAVGAKILPNADKANRANLSLLGGFAMGILAQENSDDPEWGFELLEHVRRFQSHIVEMEPKDRHQLAINLLEVFEPLKDH